MAPSKKDPHMATVTYNAQNVERSIGYMIALIDSCMIALIDSGDDYHATLKRASDYFDLSPIESAMLIAGTRDLIAPQFRDKDAVVPTAEPVTVLTEKGKAKEKTSV